MHYNTMLSKRRGMDDLMSIEQYEDMTSSIKWRTMRTFFSSNFMHELQDLPEQIRTKKCTFFFQQFHARITGPSTEKNFIKLNTIPHHSK